MFEGLGFISRGFWPNRSGYKYASNRKMMLWDRTYPRFGEDEMTQFEHNCKHVCLGFCHPCVVFLGNYATTVFNTCTEYCNYPNASEELC